MANSAFSKLLDGSLFTFTVGLEGENTKDITVHCALIAIHSNPLSALMNGKMQEAQERKARIIVETLTFERFCEYVYFRAYTDPIPEPWHKPHEAALLENERTPVKANDNNSFDQGKRDMKSSKKANQKFHFGEIYPSDKVASGKSKLRTEFDQKTVSTIDSCFDIYPQLQWEPDIDTSAADFIPVLKDHSRLYVFSDQYQVHGLKSLVLHKLYYTLKQFKLISSNLKAILDLADYVFENTPSIPEEPARDLIVHYVAAHIDSFMFSQAFSERIVQGGDFAHMLMVKMYEVLN